MIDSVLPVPITLPICVLIFAYPYNRNDELVKVIYPVESEYKRYSELYYEK